MLGTPLIVTGRSLRVNRVYFYYLNCNVDIGAIMNAQLRAGIILFGAVLVILTFTFPTWQPYLNLLPGGSGSVFPGLQPDLTERFLLIEPAQRAALETLVEEEPELALDLVYAEIREDQPVPAPLQALPDMLGRVIVVTGNFIPASNAVRADGQLTIFELADGRRLVRFDEFAVTNAPAMTVWLTESREPVDQETLESAGTHQSLGELQGNVGSQNFEIAAQTDLDRYNSIAIFSEELGVIIGYAPFTITF